MEAVTAGSPQPAGLTLGRYVRIPVSDAGHSMDEATLQ
jgi:hypothetical protein